VSGSPPAPRTACSNTPRHKNDNLRTQIVILSEAKDLPCLIHKSGLSISLHTRIESNPNGKLSQRLVIYYQQRARAGFTTAFIDKELRQSQG
jgi:hypothetical protein